MLLQALLAAAADSAPSSAALWITGGLAASGGISTVISIAAVFATRREVEALDRRVVELREDNEALRRELQETERRLQIASEQRANENHRRTNEILEAVSRLAGAFHQSQHHDHTS